MVKLYAREENSMNLEFKTEGRNYDDAELNAEKIMKELWFKNNAFVKFHWNAGKVDVVYADYDFDAKEFKNYVKTIIVMCEVM